MGNVCGGASIPKNAVDSILNYLEIGEPSYQDDRSSMLADKTISIHDTISTNAKEVFPKNIPGVSSSASKISSRSDVADSQRFIEVAKERKCDMVRLLK